MRKGTKRADREEEIVFPVYTPHKKTLSAKSERIEKFRRRKKVTISEENELFNPIMRFSRSTLPEDLLKVCEDFKKPSPIQSQSWPVLMHGRDLVGIAKTGSGKTIAFGLPGLNHVMSRMQTSEKRGPFMLVLAPTRELAVQTHELCAKAGAFCNPKITSVCLFGGAPKDAQRATLDKGVQVVVATPGRLMDFMNEGAVDLSSVSFVVLDEADRMLDLGFAPDIDKILPCTMSGRQTAMFSATWPNEVKDVAARFLKNPIQVTIGKTKLHANADVKQIVEVMEPDARVKRLLNLMRTIYNGNNKILIFVLYKKECVFIEDLLRRNGYSNAAAIHGDLPQNSRDRVFAEFKSGKVPIMIATDVAARGLDVPDIEFVVNYSFPLTIEDYVHRIGRTGRAGKQGVAYTFFTSNEKALAGSLGGVLKQAGVEIPEGLDQWGMGIKRKKHSLYGLHYRDDIQKEAKKIVFDSEDD